MGLLSVGILVKAKQSKMKIFVKNQEVTAVEVSADDKVSSLKQKVALNESACFSFGGQLLNDESTLAEAGVCELSTLDVVVELQGGKVHGSLARGGKVKGQTPKVEAGEKKKKKTGRAARRQQYNRKFVNVVNTFGKSRGPNSNAKY